jgi:hypothetical protein
MRTTTMMIATLLAGASAWGQSDVAGQNYLDSLDDDAKAKTSFEFDNIDERKDWSNLPGRMHTRNGLSYGEMSDEQKAAANDLLKSGLSERGYEKASGVMKLDSIWGEIRRSPKVFNSDYYWIAIFGMPDPVAPWGWQLDGHHLAINFVTAGGQTSMAPMFFGAEPEVVPSGPHKGFQIFDVERKKAFALINSLDPEQRKKTILSDTIPEAIFEGPTAGGTLKKREGIRASELTDSQRDLLWALINEYLDNANHHTAETQRAKIVADGVEELYFAWMGATEENENVYFRVHGPSVLIEYDNVFVGRADRDQYSNHIHTILREPSNDFGEDLLRKHYEENEHHR